MGEVGPYLGTELQTPENWKTIGAIFEYGNYSSFFQLFFISKIEITSRQQPLQSSHQAIKVERINGLVGIIELVSGPYLIFIKSATSVGMFNDAEIFKVVEAELVPFKSSNLHLSEREVC